MSEESYLGEYQPDFWNVLEISGPAVPVTYYRILSGLSGGFAGADSWRLSSGIVPGIYIEDDHWIVTNHSGSVYWLGQNKEKLNRYCASILGNITANSPHGVVIKPVKMLDIYENLKLH